MRSSSLPVGVFIAAITLAGCSSHGGASLAPNVAQGTSQTRTPSSAGAYPISAQAFPISLSAYPSSASAFPISAGAYPASLDAIPICKRVIHNGHDDYEAGLCFQKRTASIPAGADATLIPGYQPVHLQGAYGVTGLSSSIGAEETVAIVTAYIDQTIASDLAVYRSTFGLPPCTVASGCLTILQPGGSRPTADPIWGEETAIDTEMVSAICPLCEIVVVEAKSNKLQDLGQAMDQANGLHPVAISNSYATPEDKDSIHYQDKWRRDDTAVVAGAGDSGYGVSFPASVDKVVAVGGTSLFQNPDGTFQPQTVWAGTGSGCSAYVQKQKWQTDTGCGKFRTVNDIAAVADPRTGVAAYSSYGGGWNMYGGTSVATPIVAGLYALTGSTHGMHDASGLYLAPSGTLAWIVGANGACSPLYLCTATGLGYNGPAGNGVPYGIDALIQPHH